MFVLILALFICRIAQSLALDLQYANNFVDIWPRSRKKKKYMHTHLNHSR